jgi:hypothetical protein
MELCNNLAWTNLKTLSLLGNKIIAEGFRAMSKTKSYSPLKTHNLSANQIGDKEARSLSKNGSRKNLQALHLGEIND